MTREEAIGVIKSECYIFNPLNFDRSTRINTALDMAIEALEKESCEEDAVSRTNLLKQFEDRFIELQKAHLKDAQLGVNWCINTLKDMPAVTPVHKKGRWIPCSERMPKQNEYIGDVCKYYLIQDDYGDMYVARYTSDGWISIDSILQDNILSWMPLPEPYKADMEAEE